MKALTKLALTAFVLAGCMKLDASDKTGCRDDGDCLSGYSCTDQTCVPVPVPPDGDVSGGDGCQGGGCDASCEPRSCSALGAACGWIDDGCGTAIQCGSCAAHASCVDNQCAPCEPTSCAALGAACGSPDDGCGGALDCGGCDEGDRCEAGACVPICVEEPCEIGATRCSATDEDEYEVCVADDDGCRVWV